MLRPTLFLTLLACAPAIAADIQIGVIPGQMRYDKASFSVQPGEKVRLTLKNTDELQHNLVVCAAGGETWKEVAQAAWAMGADGPAAGFVPKSDLVLYATRMLNPHEEQALEFTAPQAEGTYPYVCTFPGHALMMRGEMLVGTGGGSADGPRGIADVRYRYYEGSWSALPDFAKLEPKRVGKIEDNRIDITPRDRNDGFAFAFDASLTAPADGKYTFALDSDDGSRLLVDGKSVVDFDGVHGDGSVRTGNVTLKAGAHTLQVLFFEAAGGEVLRVGWQGPGFEMEPLSRDERLKGNAGAGGDYVVQVAGEPRVIRVNMPDATPRAIAIGLPGGVNACFDATTCEVRYGWTGEFLNVGPDRGNGSGRGGGTCQPLGPPFKIAAGEGPQLALPGAGDSGKPRFLGYRRAVAGPTFFYQIGQAKVSESISRTEGGALQLGYEIQNAPQGGITARFDPAAQVTCAQGKVEGGTVTIPAGTAEFSIEVAAKP